MIRHRKTLLRAGEFRLDGGSMFGLIPRSVWSRAAPPDEKGRIAVNHNCLLLERLDPAPAGFAGSTPRLVLLEVGTGDKLDAKSREIFAMEERSVLDALREIGCAPEQIGGVVVSHLHFDHAGGLTRLCRPGERPDWTGPASSFGAPRGDADVRLAFPEAEVVVQDRELQDALDNKSVMTRTYFRDHLEPVASQLRLVDTPLPFHPGYTPKRDELPSTAVARRMTEVFPGIFVFRCPGHTWGQQAVLFHDEAGAPVVFTPDVLPTAWHVGQAYSLGYDVEPYTSMVTRHWLLEEAVKGGWTLCLDHEPGHPFFRVAGNGKGWYDLEHA